MKILLTLFISLMLAHQAHSRGGHDHIGAYNWRVTVDNIHSGSLPLPTPVAADIPAFSFTTEKCTLKLCTEKQTEVLSLTFDGLNFSNNPEALANLQKALLSGSISIALTDNNTGERAYYADFRGRIKRVRIRKRASIMPGNSNGPNIEEVVEFEITR